MRWLGRRCFSIYCRRLSSGRRHVRLHFLEETSNPFEAAIDQINLAFTTWERGVSQSSYMETLHGNEVEWS